MDKTYIFEIRNEDNRVIKSGTITEKDIETFDNMGNFFSSMNQILANNESIEITKHYHE